MNKFYLIFLLFVLSCSYNQTNLSFDQDLMKKELVSCWIGAGIPSLEGCIKNFADKGYNESICSTLKEWPKYEVDCYVFFASEKGIVTPCLNLMDYDNTGDKEWRQADCIAYTAVRLQKPELCEEIINILIRDMCYYQYVGYSLFDNKGPPEEYINTCDKISERSIDLKDGCVSAIKWVYAQS